jgi:hypothetical protein
VFQDRLGVEFQMFFLLDQRKTVQTVFTTVKLTSLGMLNENVYVGSIIKSAAKRNKTAGIDLNSQTNNGQKFEIPEMTRYSLKGLATEQPNVESQIEESLIKRIQLQTNSDFHHFESSTHQSPLCASECLIPP